MVQSDRNTVHLACSKNRLAPIKRVTLPRLELLGALLASRLLRYFCEATGLDPTQATLWTDSTVALGWIQQDSSRWKAFVSNRVVEIQTHTHPSQWRHCPGTDNPADLLSRGITADKLQHCNIWWHGPSWLAKPPHHWPQRTLKTNTHLPEEKTTSRQILIVETPNPVVEATNYSSYWKLLRITGWILRFQTNIMKRDRMSGELTAYELTESRIYWIRTVQHQSFPADFEALSKNTPLPANSKIARFNPFLDNGIIRLGGRLQFADLSCNQRHPILLDGQHHFTRLLIRQTHIRLHHLGVRIVLSELRTEFWIIRARQAIKHVLNRCLPCKVAKGRFAQEIEAPLPAERVRPLKPFAVTGVDFAGPLYVKERKNLKKSYIALFTCSTTRAIHLELCSDMSTDRFLQALERFAGRRGLPNTIYSDNATTFQATNKELKELWSVLAATQTQHYFAQQGIVWKFIVPRAAWWGGWWERMIGSTKRCLRKVLGQTQIDQEGLITILVSIEAALNSRPISQCDESPDALSPAHFLVGQRLTTLPTGSEPVASRDLNKEFRRQQKITEDFWRRWQKEYLTLLKSFHEVHQPKKSSPCLRVGDVALLQEDLRPRHMWRKARIEDLLKGRDGRIRTVVLRTAGGSTISRPVQLVIPLEIDQRGEDVMESYYITN